MNDYDDNDKESQEQEQKQQQDEQSQSQQFQQQQQHHHNTCKGCQQLFPSRNAIFQHLHETNGRCLSIEEYQNFIQYVVPKYNQSDKKGKPRQVLLLIGYIPMPSGTTTTSTTSIIRNGQDAAELVAQIVWKEEQERINPHYYYHAATAAAASAGSSSTTGGPTGSPIILQSNGSNTTTAGGGNKDSSSSNSTGTNSTSSNTSTNKFHRSYGHSCRSKELIGQENGTCVITEVIAMKLLPLPNHVSIDQWIDHINTKIEEQCLVVVVGHNDTKEDMRATNTNNNTFTSTMKNDHHPHSFYNQVQMIRILGRQNMPMVRFNAELDMSHRRMEYMLPVDFIMGWENSTYTITSATNHNNTNHAHNNNNNNTDTTSPIQSIQSIPSREQLLKALSIFTLPYNRKVLSSKSKQQQQDHIMHVDESLLADDDDNDEQQLQQQQQDVVVVQQPELVIEHTSEQVLIYLRELKRKMQTFTTPVIRLDETNPVAVLQKQKNIKKRQRSRKGNNGGTTSTSNNNYSNGSGGNDTTTTMNHGSTNRHYRRSKDKEFKNKMKKNPNGDDDDDHQHHHEKANNSTITTTTTEMDPSLSSSSMQDMDTTRHTSSDDMTTTMMMMTTQPKTTTMAATTITDTSKNSTTTTKNDDNNTKKDKCSSSSSAVGTFVLKRKRFHNFTPTIMAHEFLAYRRLDRFYHRGTISIPIHSNKNHDHNVNHTMTTTTSLSSSSSSQPVNRGNTNDEYHFLILSFTGDLFLSGQVQRLVGLWLALVHSVIDPDIVDCVFDEEYGQLVPTPPVPIMGLYAVEACYDTSEGKVQAILTPRICDRFTKGWNDEATLNRVQQWQTIVRNVVAHRWLSCGLDDTTGRSIAEKDWMTNVLLPWAKQARQHLEEYRQWKKSCLVLSSTITRSGLEEDKSTSISVGPTTSLLLSPLDSIDPTVPSVYEKVLYYLRQADASGQWPSTTPKRQLVMISTPTTTTGSGSSSSFMNHPDNKPEDVRIHSSLSLAHMRAKSNKVPRSSAYEFAEGYGGASGSFSIGAMPGEQCTQPKANTMFPELMKAAFELEIALFPNREPSSTIAVNRNAQFRPHTDQGAGTGQGTSLIVGLGTYTGGELVVEGEKHSIRYKPIEFDGWKQRHWTLPFHGERFSLVWFTPKGCEGIHGIDLCP